MRLKSIGTYLSSPPHYIISFKPSSPHNIKNSVERPHLSSPPHLVSHALLSGEDHAQPQPPEKIDGRRFYRCVLSIPPPNCRPCNCGEDRAQPQPSKEIRHGRLFCCRVPLYPTAKLLPFLARLAIKAHRVIY